MQFKTIIELIEDNKTDFFRYLNKVIITLRKIMCKRKPL